MQTLVLDRFYVRQYPFTEAQWPNKVPRIGFLDPGTRSSSSVRILAFQEGLRELGYTEGKNIFIEYRFAEGKLDPLGELAAELVRLKVDIVVARTAPVVQAAKTAILTIPIVMAGVGYG